MPSKRNIELFEKAKEKVERANAVFFLDPRGLTHKQLEEARVSFKDVEGELSVVKNTLLNLAFKQKNIDLSEKLKGSLAVLFSYNDPAKLAKALQAFFKKYGLTTPNQIYPKIKFGVLEGNLISEETIIKLASLPGREILLAKLVGTMNSPIRGLVYSLNYNIAKLAFVLKAIENQKTKS